MERKALTFCIVIVLVLLTANVLAVFFLYAPSHKAGVAVAAAVAEDAAMPSEPENVASEPVATDTLAVGTVEEAGVSATAPAKPAVNVPDGPFQVKNSATGKINTLSQNDDYSLTLRDETGASQWVMPFSGDICGRVATVDFYTNGKLQFLFCSGSKLCLVDRLGRMVSTFPVTLSKEVLLGPDVYDFNSARRYNIIVLNKDNTIDMYNLKGEKPQKWTTIAPGGQIVDLPEYIEQGGKSFWAVRTSVGKTFVYSFYGTLVKTFTGEPNKNELY